MRVLIADDSKLIRVRLNIMLRELPGVTVVGEAMDGIQAVQMTQDLAPDLLILNFPMPGGTEMDTLKMVKTFTPSPMVIVITHLSSPEYRDAYLKAGADYFFDKSFEMDKVKETISALMKRS